MRYLITLLALMHLSASAANETPEAAAEAFYRWAISYGSGLPSAVQRNQLPSILTPHFVRLLAVASETERKCVAGLPPDMKGDIWEGNLFMSNYEGAAEVWYGASHVERNNVLIEANLLGVDEKRPKGDSYRTYTWQDSIKLVRTKAGWRVADVLRGDSASDSGRESLAKMLIDYIKHGCRRG